MIITDNSREYDLDRLKEYSTMTQGIVKRLIYSRYVAIRNLLSDSCCNKIKASVVQDSIKNKEVIERIKKVFNYTEKEIIFYVEYTIEQFPIVR